MTRGSRHVDVERRVTENGVAVGLRTCRVDEDEARQVEETQKRREQAVKARGEVHAQWTSGCCT